MKVSRLAKEIGMQPTALYRELVGRGLKIPSVEHPLDTISSDAVREAAKKEGRVDFDALFGAIREEFKSPTSDGQNASLSAYNRRDHEDKDPDAFEKDVGNLIKRYFPNSHLTGVFLFQADQLSKDARWAKHGREIDHLLHVKEGEIHRLLIIECKHQPIAIDQNARATIPLQHRDWTVEYGGKKKKIKEQLWEQSRAILQMLKPIPEMNLEIEAIAVSSFEKQDDLSDRRGKQDSRVVYRCMSWGQFELLLFQLKEQSSVLRISQSELMRRLRQGMPCPQLSHPDIRDAIEYHKRLRLTLDFGLFKHFDPKPRQWAINGTAGMGKSVLLAYAACVFCTDRRVKVDAVGRQSLINYETNIEGLVPLEKRRIVVYSLKEKQKRIVEYYWRLLIEMFQGWDEENNMRVHRPEIVLWDTDEPINGNVVLIDEAHDLSQMAQEKIAEWISDKTEPRYLVIACDRHQKLRLNDENAQERMISGLDFGLCTTRLKRVYRNPFAVYAGGLALMFRWFAPNGPKVIPNVKQLDEAFGFEVVRRDVKSGTGCAFNMVEDAHPANQWHHCVADFPDAATAHSWLNQYNLTSNDVLWVRFSQEDPYFDYEELQSFQYHNLHTEESTTIIDKYIKGQEFPIVIVEGVGADFNNFEDQELMFVHRRELYLCASRATVFLFFIQSSGSDEESELAIRSELDALRDELSRPTRESAATQFWGLNFSVPDGHMPLNQFEDIVDPTEDESEIDAPKKPEEGVKPEPKLEQNETVMLKAVVQKDRPSKTPNEAKKEEVSKAQTERGAVVEQPTREMDDPRKKLGLDDLREALADNEESVQKAAKLQQPLVMPDAGGTQKQENDKVLSEECTDEGKLSELVKSHADVSTSNKKGYTLLESYTPKKIAEYLDVKPFKVVHKLMNLGDDKDVLELGTKITKRKVIEELCLEFDKPAPWAHPKLGRDLRTVEFLKVPVTAGNIGNFIKQRYSLSKHFKVDLNSRLDEFGVSERAHDSHLSAFEVYVLLKMMNFDPDSFMGRLSSPIAS